MKDEKINNFIHQTCLKKGWSAGDLEKAIEDVILLKEIAIDVKDKSTINKWFNGKQTPSPEYYPIIASALGVSEEELRSGKLLDTKALEDAIKELESLRESELAEKEAALRLLWMNKYYHKLFGALLTTIGLCLLNTTFWRNGWLYLLSIILIISIIKYDNRVEKKEQKFAEKKSLSESIKNEIKADWWFIKFTFGTGLLARVSSLYLFIIVVLSFMPFMESCFYKGKFAISSTLYVILGLIMLIRGLRNK